MNYTLCLDPYSINFNPSQLSGNGFNIYTDDDNFASPIATNVPASAIFTAPLGNCGSPLAVSLFNVPAGATQILIVDNCTPTPLIEVIPNLTPTENLIGEGIPYSTECCYALIDIPESCKSFCDDCNIEFDTIDLSPVGRIIAGNLQSSCGTVTDYVIGWYRNGDYSSPAITTGFGTAFPYQFPHPLTSTTAPMVLDGLYEGIILDAIINGTQYSSVASGSGVGTPIPFESCFGTMVVNALECSNGTFSLPYTHQISLTAAGNGIPSGPVSATYLLENTTNYFAYEFTGYSIYDELEIKFISGDPSATTDPLLYSQPIYLEKLRLGSDTTTDLYNIAQITSDVYPKTHNDSSAFKRTITLTSLERNLGDKLEITVTPNPSNPQTSWVLKLQCLDTFNCDLCLFEDPIPTKIVGIELDRVPSSINSCNLQRFKYQFIACDHTGSDLWSTYVQSYLPSDGNWSEINPWNFLSVASGTFCTHNATWPSNVCAPVGSGTITFEKNNVFSNGISTTGQNLGKLLFTFNNSNDYYHYKNNLLAQEAILTSTLGPITTDPTDYKYYSGYILYVPIGNSVCGDGTTNKEYNIHRTAFPNIIFTEIPSINSWAIEIPMPEVLDGLTFSGCNNCIGLNYNNNNNSIIDTFNSSSFHYSNQITPAQTNNFSSKYTIPWGYRWLTTGSSQAPISYTATFAGHAAMLYYSANTLPFISSSNSPTGWINLPSLGGNPCPSYSASLQAGGAAYQYGYSYYYNSTWINLNTNPDDFEIRAYIINNSGTPISPPALIYSYIGGVATVLQPQFFFGGTPTLTVDPF
jgi:hypothetical protein